jgi:surfeit locus 1 family protein
VEEQGELVPRRSRLTFTLLLAAGLAFAAGFVALGAWQLERRAWKLDLIERVERRVDAPPVPAPRPEARITRDNAEYLRVTATGRFLHDRETRTQAVTDYGAGYWLLTPLATTGGLTLLVNRGFVPQDRRAPIARPEGVVTVTGLLRLTEPGGGFLRTNDPAGDRWYSRDVPAIARARRLERVAPYFVDAGAAPGDGFPKGGLTQVRFRNQHLQYALTWFALALLTLGGLVILIRYGRRAS